MGFGGFGRAVESDTGNLNTHTEQNRGVSAPCLRDLSLVLDFNLFLQHQAC